MKHPGCTSYYRDDLCEDLMKVYDRVIKEATSDCPRREVFKLVANEPAPRYYVTARRAIEVVWRMHSKKPMRQSILREKMYADIYRRSLRMMEQTGRGLANCVARVIVRPAPSFYVSPGTVKNIVSQVMNERRRKIRERNESK